MKKLLLLFLTIAGLPFTNNVIAQYSKLHDFDYNDGSFPVGSLISDGTFLYGMTSVGGTNTCAGGGCGVVFKIKNDGTGYSSLLDFSASYGKWPNGSLISDGTFLYGTTSKGGTNDLGTIFKIKPDGTGYSNLIDFTSTANGWLPNGSLYSDGIFLYGMCSGGVNGSGIIFKLKPDGTNYTQILDFDGTGNGGGTEGDLISDGIFLYGMTRGGGINNMGVVFKIKPDGTGYSKLIDFAGSTNGKNPWGSLISDGIFLYGMTASGGTNDDGVIFKIKLDGTGYSKLLDFTGTANGRTPIGSLISNGIFLYGMTESGGTNDLGVIFKIKQDGTGYSKLVDFTGTANGYLPKGSLYSDGTFLYGMTSSGGTNGKGTIFKLGLSTTNIIENNETKGFKVYPNPFTSLSTIVFTQEQKNSVIKIQDVLGKEVKTINFSGKVLEIEKGDMLEGIYFLQVIDANRNVVNKKIVVQ